MHKNATKAPKMMASRPAVESDFLLLSNDDGVVPGCDETENKNEWVNNSANYLLPQDFTLLLEPIHKEMNEKFIGPGSSVWLGYTRDDFSLYKQAFTLVITLSSINN